MFEAAGKKLHVSLGLLLELRDSEVEHGSSVLATSQ